MFFSSWSSIMDILIKGMTAYLVFVITIRLYGKRSLAKMNAFDFVVTIAVGSVLASTLTSSSLRVSDGLAALVILFTMQFTVTKISVHLKPFNRVIKSKSAILFYKGRFQTEVMKRERVTEEEVLTALRNSGKYALDSSLAVVLEADGSMSVVPLTEDKPVSNTSFKNIMPEKIE